LKKQNRLQRGAKGMLMQWRRRELIEDLPSKWLEVKKVSED